MKRFFFGFWMLCFIAPVYAAALSWQNVELIAEEPTRPYETLGPVWESAPQESEALAKAKKSAYKQGADAIIHYRESTTKKYVIPTGEFGTGGVSNPRPLIEGDAVRWK